MRILIAAILGLTLVPLQAQHISAARIRAHVKFLSSDLLEGRGVGARGGALTTEYIATQFALAGAKPAGDNGGYFQRVPLTGVETAPEATLTAQSGDGTMALGWLADFVGATHLQSPLEEFEAELVFAGHGIIAPEYQWDDFKGLDVRGKVLIMFTNEPPSKSSKFFDGEALTYYGRWTYKFEQALRKGAVAAILIHTTPTAGYGWQVVRNSWGAEDAQLKLAPETPALAFAGWITQEAGEKLLALAGRSVDELLKLARSRDFRPIPLGIRLRGRIPSKVRDIETRNVAAVVAGSDANLASEVIIYSAHWDHLGIGPEVNGDAIYNGAVDNATGCAILLELARAWAALEAKPRRSALFLAVTAEEDGLRGSEYYAGHPIFPPDSTAAALNYDSFHPFGRTRDIVVTGAERTSVWSLVREAARRYQLAIKPDPRPAQGSYFRSDHFSLAKAGIPAFSIKMGTDYAGRTPEQSRALLDDYSANHYHRPSDEFRDEWDFSGLAQVARFGFLLGRAIANQDRLPARTPATVR